MLAIVLAVLISVVYSNPLRRSEATIRESLLQDMPLGTKLSEVHDFILEQDWKLKSINEETGFYDQRTKPPKETGEQSIRASLGNYHNPFLTNVTVFWGFDRNSELIDIWVWKTTDSL